MSTANISDKHWNGSQLIVVFECRDGSTREYAYSGSDANYIDNGGDPRNATPDSGPPTSGKSSEIPKAVQERIDKLTANATGSSMEQMLDAAAQISEEIAATL